MSTNHGPRTPGVCDECEIHGPRSLVVDDDRHRLLCDRCALTGAAVLPVPAPSAGTVLASAAATIQQGGTTDVVHVVGRCASALVSDPVAATELAARAVVALMRHFQFDQPEQLAGWVGHPERTRADVVRMLGIVATKAALAGDSGLAQPASPGPNVEMIDGGPPVPTTQLGVADRLLTVETAVTSLAGALDNWGERLGQMLATALGEQRERIDRVDSKVTEFARATAEDMAAMQHRIEALEAALGQRTVAEAEQILRGQ